jgi:endogenous inhibitor of DNA gyrase (YacG/DUF329 family)
MTRLTFECPETGKPLPAMTVDDAAPEMRLAVHCPKCSKLHVFTNGDAVKEREIAFS